MHRLLLWLSIPVVIGVCALVAQEPNPISQAGPQQGARPNLREFLGLGPAPDVAAAKLGEQLYAGNCSTCHGKAARGAQGPNLVRSPLVLHDEKGEGIGPVIKAGRPQAGMPGFPSLSESQIYQIAEYIHLQVELAANRGTYRDSYGNLRNRVTGDAEKGRQFFSNNCASCHSITGDLSGIGKRYPQPSTMVGRIAWPASTNPKLATVITESGEKVTGALAKLDDFDIAIRDSEGSYRSWSRTQVKVNIPDNMEGHRALLPKYSDADLHNLTAYLVTIK